MMQQEHLEPNHIWVLASLSQHKEGFSGGHKEPSAVCVWVWSDILLLSWASLQHMGH